jgi:hypothetical protein
VNKKIEMRKCEREGDINMNNQARERKKKERER